MASSRFKLFLCQILMIEAQMFAQMYYKVKCKLELCTARKIAYLYILNIVNSSYMNHSDVVCNFVGNTLSSLLRNCNEIV